LKLGAPLLLVSQGSLELGDAFLVSAEIYFDQFVAIFLGTLNLNGNFLRRYVFHLLSFFYVCV
jgi:hypothetical protein